MPYAPLTFLQHKNHYFNQKWSIFLLKTILSYQLTNDFKFSAFALMSQAV